MFSVPHHEQAFQLAASARLLTPQEQSGGLVWRALQERLSITASPLASTPLAVSSEPHQRIYCESSGSSGAPKLIRRTPASWMASFQINAHGLGVGPDDHYAVLGHMGHSLSLYATLEALHVGAGLALLPNMGPERWAAALCEHQITTIYATPSQLRIILCANTQEWPLVRRILVGGGHLDQTLRKQLRLRFPTARVAEFFGASETSFVTLANDQTPMGSVGRAYPGVELRIGSGLPTGETGEIWVKSPYLFEGYERGESAITRWQEGYLSVGEMGALDAQGYLFLRGRRSRMVTVADQNVFPEAIEAVVLAQPGVDAVAVITPQDHMRGCFVVAAVVGDIPASVLRKECRAALGAAAVPRVVWPLEALPMLPAGKPDLKRLEALWAKRRP